MSSENWQLEKDLCRCCHSEGSFKNLAEPVRTTGLAEIYADMLNECFDIDMAPVPGLLSEATYTICEACVIRLRDASDFKKQVLSCEERFKDLYNRNGIKVAEAAAPLIDIEVKQEVLDSEPDDELKEEIARDDNIEDDEDSIAHNESLELDLSEQVSEEEKSPEVEVGKKRKTTTKKTVACKTSRKRKQKGGKEENAGEENDAEKKKGPVVFVAPKFFLREEDYKKIGDMYHCVRCDKTYRKRVTLRNHVKLKHYKIPSFKCQLCNERLMNPAAVIAHKMKEHNVDDRVQCSLCNKLFNTKVLLTTHINNSHMAGDIGERYKCEICDYETFKYGCMYKHKFNHKTEKDFICKFCNKSFMRSSTLNLHERIHTGDRRKVCTVCGQAFVQKASLNYHMTKFHPEVNF